MTNPTTTTQAAVTQKSWRAKMKEDNKEARAATRLAFEVLKTHPGMAWLKVGTEALSWCITIIAMFAFASSFLIEWWTLDGAVGTWFTNALNRLMSQTFQLTTVGLCVSVVALHLALSAWSDGAVWGSFKRLTRRHEDVEDEAAPSLTAHAVTWFADALAWRVMRSTIRVGVALLGGMTYVSLIKLGAVQSPVLVALISGLIYSALILFLILTTLTLEIAPAVQVIKDIDLGAALLHAAELAIEKLFVFYRIAVLCALLLLIPFALYWMVFLVGQLPEGQNSALLMAARMMVEVLLFISMAFAGVVFRGASILYTGVTFNVLPSLDKTLHGVPTNDISADGQEEISLSSYQPPETPNIFKLSDVLAAPPMDAPAQTTVTPPLLDEDEQNKVSVDSDNLKKVVPEEPSQETKTPQDTDK